MRCVIYNEAPPNFLIFRIGWQGLFVVAWNVDGARMDCGEVNSSSGKNFFPMGDTMYLYFTGSNFYSIDDPVRRTISE